MPNKAKNFIFIALKRVAGVLLIIFSITCSCLFAQDKTVQGIAFDADSKQRITRVYIYNLRSNRGIFNNTKGEFSVAVQQGDTLLAALEDYRPDTITYHNQNTLIFFLKRRSIRLKEVNIRDTIRTPGKELSEAQRDYNDIYRKGNNKDVFSIGPGGAGLSIDALYSMLSKEGKNARFLQKIIERDYRESMIDYRFSKGLVSNATGLSGNDLEDFMQQYRPSYYFILEANDYALLKFIKDSYQKYLKNPAAYRLPPLITPSNK